ncbi:alkyl hydroperoxide reductase [Pseudonocardiaceae bacterium YIM PH 21723]|nr:alkyl hydroperoxide reductase [Pseudonocardiaceae bacterium YIM PH 21723]
MSLDNIKKALPDYAKDTKLNLGTVIGTSTLTPQQTWGTVIAAAATARNAQLLAELAEDAKGHLSAEAFDAAKAAASITSMNNIYYRAKHLIGDDEYNNLPARLRMHVIGKPGVDKLDFELWALAVSAINGCSVCLEGHEKAIRAAGASRDTVHEVLRIAGVVFAAAVTLETEAALA